MSERLHVAIFTGFLLSCAIVGARERASRRSVTLEADETAFISSYDSFLEDVDGNQTKSYWPDGVNPEEEFGLMQKAMISDMLLQLCIMSGVYVRPPRPKNQPVGNDSSPVYKKNEQLGGEQRFSEQRDGKQRGSEKRSSLFDELLNLIRTRRQTPLHKRQTTESTTQQPESGTGPPVENWQDDPYDVLEDCENQFTNLCISLFELRRLNRRLARQRPNNAAP